jgi:hypothetical protein
MMEFRQATKLRHSRKGGLLVVILLGLANLCGQTVFADQDSSIVFSWAFVYQGRDETTKPIDYSKSVVRLESGDRLKIYLKPLNACHFYLYLHDSQKNLYLLFPEDFTFFDKNLQVTRKYDLPGVNSWFYLDDNGGIEVFYLIVSDQRLQSLEEITKQYLEGRAKRRNLQNITYKHGVLDEIKRIIKENSYLSDAVEKPIAVAGDFRGIREEDELNGVSIEAADVYVKTIRLAH